MWPLAPKLIEEVVPKMVSITFQKVLQPCWKSPCTSATSAPSSKPWPTCRQRHRPPPSLARRVRIAPGTGHRAADLRADARACRDRHRTWAGAPAGAGPSNANGQALDPGGRPAYTEAAEVALKQEELGMPACLLVPDDPCSPIAVWCAVAPRLQVLARSEIPETHTIRIGPILQGASS